MSAPDNSLSAHAATEDRTVAMVAYLTFVGFLVAVVLHSSKKTQVGAFHLRQALGLILTAIACWPLNLVLAFIPVLGWLCMLAILFSLAVLWVMGFLGALKGEQNPVPVLGDAYQRWFANAFT